MKRKNLFALFCLTAFFLPLPVFTQSLYQDALDLARIMQQNQAAQISDALYIRLDQAMPYWISTEMIGLESVDTIFNPSETDYLVTTHDRYPDELLLYRSSDPEKVLFSTPVKYEFYIFRLREKGSHDQFTLLSPSGETIAVFSDTALIGSDLVITGREAGNLRFFESEFSVGEDMDNFFPEKVSAISQAMKDGVLHVFPAIPRGDTLVLKNADKVLLQVFNDEARDKFIYNFFLDSIKIEVDGSDFTAEKRDSRESDAGPFVLISAKNFFGHGNTFLALAIADKGNYILEQGDDNTQYRLETKSPKVPAGSWMKGKNFTPEKIPLREINRRIFLSKQCEYAFNQITLFNGSRLLKTIHLTRPKSIEEIGFNERTNSIDFSVTRNIRQNESRFLNYRKKYETSRQANLRFLIDPEKFDYCCEYASFLEDYLISDKPENEAAQQARLDAFEFEARVIRPGSDTTFRISQRQLEDMPLEKNVLYILRLDTMHARQKIGLLDFSDLSFRFYFYDYNNPFHWYPALNPVLEVFVQDSTTHIFHAPAVITEHFSIPIFQKDSLAVLLGAHSQMQEADLFSAHLWGDISEKYRNNPYLARYLEAQLARTRFDPASGISNPALRTAIQMQLKTYFGWQNILFGDGQVQAGDQVAYDELVNTYRTRIPTASDKLQVASEQFNNETQKLRRGLNTAALAAGLSDFIVERAQEELNLNFLNHLRDRIQRDSEFMVLFPQTVKMMGDFRIEQYRTLLDFAKSAFVQDLRNLGVTFPRLFSVLSRYKALENDPKVYNLFLLYDIANKVYEGTPVEDVLLHIHSRLKERQTSLEDAIHKELGKKLVRNTAPRAQISDYILNYGNALVTYYARLDSLERGFMTNWERLWNEMKKESAGEDVLQQMSTLNIGTTYFDQTRTGGGLAHPNFDTTLHLSRFRFISDNLMGDPGYEYLKNNLEFNRFRTFFSRQPDSSRTISLGLAQADAMLSGEQIVQMENALREIEEKISSLQVLQDNLESARAKSINSVSGYLPLLKKYKSLMVRRLCLELAIDFELFYHRQADKHDIESLRYLQGVLQEPKKFNLYNWEKLDDFGHSLRQIGLTGSKPPGILYFDDKDPNTLYEGYKLLSLVSSDAGDIEAEIARADVFLESMASTMRDHFPFIAATRDPKTAQKDSMYYRLFLYSNQMTDGSLVLDFEGLKMHMNRQIMPSDTALTGRDPELALDASEIETYEYRAAFEVIQPLRPTGNRFLDYYDQTLPFEPEAGKDKTMSIYNAGLAKEVESVRASVSELKSIRTGYRGFLEKLRIDSTAAPLAALGQAAQFDTLVSMTLMWMHAFRNAAAPGDSTVIVQDTVVVHKKILSKSGMEITYDSMWIIPRVKGASQWMSLQQFNDMMDDTLQRKVFLGLLYQQLSATGSDMHYSAPNLALLATKFMNTVYEIDDARAILHYKKEHNNTLGFEDYYPFIRSIVDMLNVVLETPLESNNKPLKDRLSQLRDVPDISNESLSLFENIFAENYGSAIRNVVQLLSITWGLRQTDKAYADAATVAYTKSDRRGNEKLKAAVLTYGSFMATMVEAQTPDQVKAAISAVAVPPGSSSLKRNARMNVSVNGYFGLGFHRETLLSDSIASNLRQSGTIGLSVPVGITFSMGQFQIGKRTQSFSLFVPVLDLGAVTSYRIDQKGLSSELPKLTFGNLVAPGAYLLWNIPKSPFTIGGGAQFGPQLRQITVDGAQTSSSAWRYGLTASVDVPIFNLYTQQERALRKRRK